MSEEKKEPQIFMPTYGHGTITSRSYGDDRRAQEARVAKHRQAQLEATILSFYDPVHHSHRCEVYIHREEGTGTCSCWLSDSAKDMAQRLTEAGYRKTS